MAGPIALAALAIAALIVGRGHALWEFGQPGAGLLPFMAAMLLLGASVASLRSARPTGPRRANWRVAAYVGGLVVLPPAVLVLGMLPALGLFVAIVLRAVERMRLWMALLIAISSVAGCWLLFERLLNVPLPKPMFW